MALNVPTITHPTGRPNFSRVEVGENTYWFSYETCIAFYSHTTGMVVSENVWGPTTGKHINYVSDKAERRLSRDQFEAALAEISN